MEGKMEWIFETHEVSPRPGDVFIVGDRFGRDGKLVDRLSLLPINLLTLQQKKQGPSWFLVALLAIAAAFGIGLWAGGITGHNRAECEWSSAIQLWTDMGLSPQDPNAMMKERICAFKKDLEADRLRRIQEKSR
jgi:hypothetical protein